MTTIYTDPAEFTDHAVDGFVDLYADRLRRVEGGVVRRFRPGTPKVAVLVGGGSGHYPAFAGVVGPGFADGAVIGNVFTSPSAAQACSVGRSADSGAGVIFTYGNYAGDVMNFGLAAQRLRAEGIDVRQVVVTDDVASAPARDVASRRGIAGGFVVYKVMGAAAERGWGIDDVQRLGELANARTFTIGLAFSGCTFPGADHPLFTVPAGMMGLGLGIHGEPGLEDVPWLPADTLADLMVDRLLQERPSGSSGRVAALLNGLGATKYEELFLLWGIVAKRLRSEGLETVDPEVGELVTSLDMRGVSLTLCWLDPELEPLWSDPADTPAWRRGRVLGPAVAPTAVLAQDETVPDRPVGPVVVGSPASRSAARVTITVLRAVRDRMHAAEDELGRLDAVAGDGDHGRGMARGSHHALVAAEEAYRAGWGVAGVLGAAGDAWAGQAGGTSGVLWGTGLRALGAVLGDEEAVGPDRLAEGVGSFVQAMTDLGGAALGDKTIVDAAIPFRDELSRRLTLGDAPARAWSAAARAALSEARATSALRPRLGRARPLAERSVGHPDPGAVSFVMCVEAAGDLIGRCADTERSP